MKTFKQLREEIANSVGGGFMGQAVETPNPNLAGKDLILNKKKKMIKRKNPNV